MGLLALDENYDALRLTRRGVDRAGVPDRWRGGFDFARDAKGVGEAMHEQSLVRIKGGLEVRGSKR